MLLILVVVAAAFRSLLAPLTVLAIAGVGYAVYFPLLSTIADALGFEVPSQLEPVLVALLLGVVTDYCVLFFAAFRTELDAGRSAVPAARAALARDGSVVAVAGLTVAGGTIALLAAPFAIFRGLGPALALTVLVGLAVCLTLTPALMTVLGWRLFTVLPVRGSARGRPSAAAAAARPGQRVRRPARHAADPARAGGSWPCCSSSSSSGSRSCRWPAPGWTCPSPPGCPQRRRGPTGRRSCSTTPALRGITAPTEVLLEQDGVTAQRLPLAAARAADRPAARRQPGHRSRRPALGAGPRDRAGDLRGRRPLPRRLRQRPARRARR